MFIYSLASATCSPWRDELSNTHDMIMVGALLMTLVVAQTLRVPSTMGDGWFTLLETASSLIFLGAVLVCGGVLVQHLLKELVLFWETKKLASSQDLPNLMKTPAGEGSKGFGDFSASIDASAKLRKRISL